MALHFIPFSIFFVFVFVQRVFHLCFYYFKFRLKIQHFDKFSLGSVYFVAFTELVENGRFFQDFFFIFPSHCHVYCILSDSMLLMATVYRQWRRWNGNVCRFHIYTFDVIFDLPSTPNNSEQTKTAKIILRQFQIRYFI